MIPEPEKKTIRRVEILAGIGYTVALIVGLFAGSQSTAVSLALGGALSILNFDLLRRTIGKVFEDPALVKSYYFLFVLLRFAALAAVVGFLLWRGLVAPVPFAVGFSVILIGIVLEGILSARRAEGAEETGGADERPRHMAETGPDRERRERMLR